MDCPDHQLMDTIAIQERRVIITRDRKFFIRNFTSPCYILQNSVDTSIEFISYVDKQFLEISAFFKLSPQASDFLIRCVKCNNSSLVVIDSETAK
jgi:uncharacterized protein with PIN domain